MQMARARKEEFEAVYRFLQGVETICERGEHPDTGLPLDDQGEVMQWLDKEWRTVEGSSARVVLGGMTAVENACDPTLDVLEFKPEIKKWERDRANLLAALKVARVYVERQRADEEMHGIARFAGHAANVTKSDLDLVRKAIAEAEAP